jgi:hypothetical protein
MIENSDHIVSSTKDTPANFTIISHREFYILLLHPEFRSKEREPMSMEQIYEGGKIRNFHVFVDTKSLGRMIVGSSTQENGPGAYFVENSSSPEMTELNSTEGPVLALRSRQAIVNLGEENHKYRCTYLSEKRYNFFTYVLEKFR